MKNLSLYKALWYDYKVNRLSTLLIFLVILSYKDAWGSIPASDITLDRPVNVGIPTLGYITGYEMSSGNPGGTGQNAWNPAEFENPLYYPYDRNESRWWDNLVEEVLFSRAHVIFAHGRGCYSVSGPDTSGNGNMCPRLLSELVGAIQRAGASGIIKVGMWDDTAAYQLAAKTYEGSSDPNYKFDMSNSVLRDEVIWKRNIRIWHDTVPQSLWFNLPGTNRPIIAMWSIGDAFFKNQANHARILLIELSGKFYARYGVKPYFLLDQNWLSEDPTVSSLEEVIGVNNWFTPPVSSYTYRSFKNRTWGVAVPSFRDVRNTPGCGVTCREIPRNNGYTLSSALNQGYTQNASLVLLEGATNVIETAGFYRSDDISYDYPSQPLQIVRNFADLRTSTLRLQAEACDTYSDSTSGNSGSSYRNGDLDVSTLPGSGWIVTNTAGNEWLKFQDIKLSEGNYRFSARAKASASGKSMRLELNGISLGSKSIPVGSFDNFHLGEAFVQHGDVDIEAIFETDGIELDWIFVKKIDPTVSLKTLSNYYVSAEAGGGDVLTADRISKGIWETFVLIDKNGGHLQSGDVIRLQTYNGHFVVTEGGGGGAVNADRLIPNVWEEFTIIKVGGSGVIASGDTIALRANNNVHHFVAELGGGGTVNADRTSIGPWEKFILTIE